MLQQTQDVLRRHKELEFHPERRSFTGFAYASEADADKYSIEVQIESFPDRFPRVFETAERIPRQARRHCNSDGSLCFTTKPREELLLATAVFTLDDFFDKILIPCLQNNSYFEHEGKYRFGEHSHHSAISIYETYKPLLDLEDPIRLEQVLTRLANGMKIRPNELCYCGSGNKIKRCKNHETLYRDIKKLSVETLADGRAEIAQVNAELEKLRAQAASAK